MNLKQYQKKAVDQLLESINHLLKKSGQRICVFKAPTGSGKTIMIADLLDQFAQQENQEEYVFLWISGNELHKQSKDKLQSHLVSSRYNFSLLENTNTDVFGKDEVVFINWHSLTKKDREGEWSNVLMRDNEKERNLPTLIRKTKEAGRQIILIVDESHYHYLSEQTQQLVQEVINPKLIIEVSATPKIQPTPDELVNKDAGYVVVNFKEVIEEGMIKESIIINANVDQYKDLSDTADEAIIDAALKMREQLLSEYHKEKSSVNPLVLIQLPSEKEAMSALDQTKLEFVQGYLDKKHSINVDNRKLAIWLSEQKENKEGIENIDNEVEVLIFKQAIALGWDCPRAQILVMFRDIKNVTFEIQTVGRVLRMPEIKRYDSDLLNSAYVYTNLEKIAIAQEKDSQSFFKVYRSQRKQGYTNVVLFSVYIPRTDYGDLTLAFRKFFIEEANKRFGITKDDIMGVAYEKADKDLELYPEELTKPVITNALLSNIDNAEDIIGDTTHFDIAEDELKYRFTQFAKLTALPFAPSRSHTKIQQSVYDWFDNFLDYKGKSRIEIQRIVTCSESNQKIFVEIIERAKNRFKDSKVKLHAEKRENKEYKWDVAITDYFSELYEKKSFDNYALEECYLLKQRSEPEKQFENYLSDNKNVEWWYKNGTSKETYFALAYIDSSTGLERAFYPDFVCLTKEGKVGIFDTKSGITLSSIDTQDKANTLYGYLNKDKKLFGGIVNFDKEGLRVFTGEGFTSDLQDAGWHDVRI